MQAILSEQVVKPEAKISQYKRDVVAEIVGKIKEYQIIGIVNMENLPAKQLQKLRANLRGKVYITMTKRKLISIALEQASKDKKGIENLEEFLGGMPGIIFTNDNPFRLYNLLQKSKSKAFAKPNQIAPDDIHIQAGPTPFAPGPIIGELASIGIKSGVESGKVAIKQDALVAKKGEQIKPKVAEILIRLGIEPMQIGLNIKAVYEDGVIYNGDVLSVDEVEFSNRLSTAGRNAFNLAVYLSYPTKTTIKYLIYKAFTNAKALGIAQNIYEKELMPSLIGKAEMHARVLKQVVDG
ncbi:MAG: 50S ribosomal protein L10 [Nanoarchaeota archaeon]